MSFKPWEKDSWTTWEVPAGVWGGCDDRLAGSVLDMLPLGTVEAETETDGVDGEESPPKPEKYRLPTGVCVTPYG